MNKKQNKKIETIRVNEKLALLLEDVPKGISYANWISDKMERLEAHEQNSICWIISTSNVGPNRMSVGDVNGKNPIFDEVIEIVFEIPKTNSSREERGFGWLGQNNDYSSYAHGGFASVESARTYIKDYMEVRFIENNELLESEYPYDENMEIYTTAKYDEYYFVSDYFDLGKPDVNGLTNEQIRKLAEKEEKKANEQGFGLLGNVEKYLIELRDSKLQITTNSTLKKKVKKIEEK